MPSSLVKRPTTLRDVAAAAGVSAKTVSRVVRGEGGYSKRTARLVEETIRRIGYKPNTAARDLRRRRDLSQTAVTDPETARDKCEQLRIDFDNPTPPDPASRSQATPDETALPGTNI